MSTFVYVLTRSVQELAEVLHIDLRDDAECFAREAAEAVSTGSGDDRFAATPQAGPRERVAGDDAGGRALDRLRCLRFPVARIDVRSDFPAPREPAADRLVHSLVMLEHLLVNEGDDSALRIGTGSIALVFVGIDVPRGSCKSGVLRWRERRAGHNRPLARLVRELHHLWSVSQEVLDPAIRQIAIVARRPVLEDVEVRAAAALGARLHGERADHDMGRERAFEELPDAFRRLRPAGRVRETERQRLHRGTSR